MYLESKQSEVSQADMCLLDYRDICVIPVTGESNPWLPVEIPVRKLAGCLENACDSLIMQMCFLSPPDAVCPLRLTLYEVLFGDDTKRILCTDCTKFNYLVRLLFSSQNCETSMHLIL